ncbi:hypothetical protein ScPMuIL_013904 [Solemya velum]
MKKVSAFAVFKAKKDKEGSSLISKKKKHNKNTRIRRSVSEPTISDITDEHYERESERLVKFRKGGSVNGSRKSCSAILVHKDDTSPHESEYNHNDNRLQPEIQEIDLKQILNNNRVISDGGNIVSRGKRPLEDAEPNHSTSGKKLKKQRNIMKPKLSLYDSEKEGKRLFQSLIHPVKPAKFFKELWEKKPLLVKRHIPNYNDGWFSTAELDRILRKEHLNFTENIDVVSYTDGKRETHNPFGRAYAPVVWDYYQNGCSVRVLNPQTYSRNVWKLLSVLQEFLHCCCGANVYLTPPGTQGFAPHYDDIEAFILQLEGKKHWRLYGSRDDSDILPRFSSNNFNQEEIGEPILDTILEPGDLLYFPRGVIHQGDTMEDAHSLHITFSCYQKNSWGDLLTKLVPAALDIALDEDTEFRQGLPRNYLNYMGIANSEVESPDRTKFLKKIEKLMIKLISYGPLDAACDQMGKNFIHDSLPPVFTEAEKSHSIHGAGERWDAEKKEIVGTVELSPDTSVKIIRKGVIRLVSEDDEVRIYHSLENSRVYHEKDPQYIEVPPENGPVVEYLLHSYPDFVTVDSFPMFTMDEKMEFATLLYEHGFLVTGGPLERIYESDDDDDESLCSGSDEKHS